VQKYGDTAFLKHLSEGGVSGPFKLDQYNSGKYASFVPNSNYWGSKPQLQKIVFPFYKDPQTAYKAYQTNQLDLANVPPTNLDQARALSNNQYRQVPQLTIDYFAMNYLAKPFNNIKIRQAFALAVDKSAIEKSINKGARLATNHIIPQGMPGYNPNLKGPAGVTSVKGDKALAKQLFQQGMQEEGYKTSNKRLDDVSNTVGNGKLQMWFAAWGADYPDPQDWTTLLFGAGSPSNSPNYGMGTSRTVAIQKQMQDLMLKADVNQNATQRLAQYNQIEQQMVDDVAWMPVDQRTLSYVLKPCVQGVVDNAQDLIPPGDWANIYKTSDSPCANTDAYK
jgi:peptide/nickel transport system substrate-binding protein/oligopeptide transport system substrate-binding protein